MPVTLNGRTWQLSDFAPWGFARNWTPFFDDLITELSRFQGPTLRDQTATSASAAGASARTAENAVSNAGAATATALTFAAASRSLVTAGDVQSVFLYDTRNDSDGGAWTEKCQGASWYHETLNSATRGGRRRFPRVALIVVRAGSITLYDAHDLDTNGTPRMWMVFQGAGTAVPMNGTTHNPTAVTALNGTLYVSIGGTAGFGVMGLDFTADMMWVRDGGTFSRRNSDIASRNASGVTRVLSVAASAILVSSIANHMHARVLPGAPLNSAGLPIPTVAVATAAGVSVIHPWGVVCGISDNWGYGRVLIAGDGRLYVSSAVGNNVDFGRIPYVNANSASWRVANFDYRAGVLPLMHGYPKLMVPGAMAGSLGLNFLAEDLSHPTNGMVAYATTTYATGWMPGDIRGAYLCDMAAGSITGSAELVSNGDFSGGTTGWTVTNATQTVASGELEMTATVNGGRTTQAIATVVGQTYLVCGTYRKGTTTAARVTAFSGVPVADTFTTSGTSVSFLFQFVALAATSEIYLVADVSGTAYFDNISVRLAMPDRSYKGKGPRVNGTLSRTALPCGLAAVSGFGTSNYLEQPYNPDLNHGTSDFAIAAWVHSGVTGTWYADVFDRGTYSGGAYTSGNVSLRVYSGASLNLTIRDSAGSSTVQLAGGAPDNRWFLVTAVRRSGVLELWVDGVLAASQSAAARNIDNTAAVTRIGHGLDGFQQSVSVQFAMVRITAYAPTPAQIRRMWEDERALIVGGTPATLGGGSDNVTALSANDATGTLVVGTTDGVSVFNNLGRVATLNAANTGAAIGGNVINAVSASGPHLLIASTANAGLVSDATIARDRLLPTAPPPMASSNPQVMRVQGVTLDATATDLSPRLYVGEREMVTVELTVMARTYGAASGPLGTFRRIARYHRNAGGNVTLVGSVNVLGSDHGTNAGMDVLFGVDTNAQTLSVRVTGVANTRIVWTARLVVTRLAEDMAWPA